MKSNPSYISSESSPKPSPIHSNSSTNNLFNEVSLEENYLIELNAQKYILDKFNSPVETEPATKTNFIKITDYLYTGNIGSIKNERKMCKLGIEYLIDMTNLRPDDLNRKTLGRVPCLCKRQHSRFHLSVEIADTSFKMLFKAFLEVNKIIQCARKAKNERKVLIFGMGLFEQQVVCACLQYLMVEYEFTLDESLQAVLNKASSNIANLKMNKFYLDYLKRFQVYLKHVSESLNGYNVYDRSQKYDKINKKNSMNFYDFYSNQELKDDESFKYSPVKKNHLSITNNIKNVAEKSEINVLVNSKYNSCEIKNAQTSSRQTEKKETITSKVAWM